MKGYIIHFSHKYNIASKKWTEPFTDLLPCLFDHMHRSTPDLPEKCLVTYVIAVVSIYMGSQELAPISSKLIFILLTLQVSEINLFCF